MSSLPEFKFRTDKEIMRDRVHSNEEIMRKLLSDFPRNECVNYHDLRRLNAVCGCSNSDCIKIRYTRTENNERFDVVKMVDRKITVVMNDVVSIKSEKKSFLI